MESPQARKPLYRCYKSMLRRCKYPSVPNYRYYGGRGITVVDCWQGRGGFDRFVKDVGPRPSPKHQLDRIDNDRGYEPGNVRWVLPKENCRNRRSNRILTVNGQSKTVAEWIELCGLSRTTIQKRLNLGWTHYEVLHGRPETLKPDYGEPVIATGSTRNVLEELPVGSSVFIRCSRQRIHQLANELGLRLSCEVRGKCVNVTRLDTSPTCLRSVPLTSAHSL